MVGKMVAIQQMGHFLKWILHNSLVVLEKFSSRQNYYYELGSGRKNVKLVSALSFNHGVNFIQIFPFRYAAFDVQVKTK